MNEYLLRVWGRDTDAINVFRPADLVENDDRLLNYWFATAVGRQQFMDSMPNVMVVHSAVDPGTDAEGEDILTRALTVALVVLRFPDGEEVTFEESFGYGYPEHAVRYMFEDGNYSCDCNRQLMAERHCGRVPLSEDLLCGDTIELVLLVVEKRLMQVVH